MSITYNGINSDTYGLTVKPETISIVPERVRTTQEIIGFNGIIDYDIDRYAEKQMAFTLQFPYVGNDDYVEKTESISKWLIADGKNKKLVLSQYPDRYYMAKSVGEITATLENGVVYIPCTFICNPPFPYSVTGSLLDPTWLSHNGGWDTCTWGSTVYQKDLTNGNNYISFSVETDMTVSPVIYLIGNINYGVTVACGSKSIRINTSIPYDGVIIDCENETVKRMSDNSSIISSCLITGGFFDFSSGNYTITLSSLLSGYNATILVDFRSVLT